MSFKNPWNDDEIEKSREKKVDEIDGDRQKKASKIKNINSEKDNSNKYNDSIKSILDGIAQFINGSDDKNRSKRAGKENSNNSSSNDGGNDNSMKKVGKLLLFASIFYWASTGFYTVNTDEQALIVRFGKYIRTANPGLNYKLPFPFEEMIKISVTRLHKVIVGNVEDGDSQDSGDTAVRSNNRYDNPTMSSGRRFKIYDIVNRKSDMSYKSESDDSRVLTGDENIIEMSYFVQYRIKKPELYIFNVNDRDDSLVMNASRSVMSTVLGGIELYDALSEKRHKIENEAKEKLQGMLNSYNSGIEVVNVGILRSYVAPQVRDAYRDLQSAKADKQSLINKAITYRNSIIPKARGDAYTIVEESKAYAADKVAKAEGEAIKFTAIAKEIAASRDIGMTNLYLSRIASILERVPKIVVDGGAGKSLSILNLDKIIGNIQGSGIGKSDNVATKINDELSASGSENIGMISKVEGKLEGDSRATREASEK